MIALPLYLGLACLTIWGFFSTGLAGWIFISAVLLFTGWLLLLSHSLRSKWIAGLSENAFTHAELQVFRRYSLYFMLPFQAKQYSSTFTFAQLLCVVWGGVCLWKGEWILLGAMIALFFVASTMAPFLNQGNFLRLHHIKGKLSPELVDRLEAVEGIEDKVLKARGLGGNV
jgi:hypothetical protein